MVGMKLVVVGNLCDESVPSIYVCSDVDLAIKCITERILADYEEYNEDNFIQVTTQDNKIEIVDVLLVNLEEKVSKLVKECDHNVIQVEETYYCIEEPSGFYTRSNQEG